MSVKKRESLLRNGSFQTILASLLCIALGLLVGYIVLLIINPGGASKAIMAILKNYMYYPSAAAASTANVASTSLRLSAAAATNVAEPITPPTRRLKAASHSLSRTLSTSTTASATTALSSFLLLRCFSSHSSNLEGFAASSSG